MQEYRQQQFDLLADGVRRALDMNALYAAMGLEGGTPYDTATPSAADIERTSLSIITAELDAMGLTRRRRLRRGQAGHPHHRRF